jgi:membrane carboxypeptidase/penicillin-binding protein PbpC
MSFEGNQLDRVLFEKLLVAQVVKKCHSLLQNTEVYYCAYKPKNNAHTFTYRHISVRIQLLKSINSLEWGQA